MQHAAVHVGARLRSYPWEVRGGMLSIRHPMLTLATHQCNMHPSMHLGAMALCVKDSWEVPATCSNLRGTQHATRWVRGATSGSDQGDRAGEMPAQVGTAGNQIPVMGGGTWQPLG